MTAEHDAWLNLTKEDPIDPDLPICDPHHHFWDPLDGRNRHYLLEDLRRDIGSGHHIVKTVYVECSSRYRKDGPKEMLPVGETEFVEGIAARSATERQGTANVAAGIAGFADLALGDGVAPVLEAHITAGKGRFRGIRHSSTWDASPEVPSYMRSPRGQMLDPRFRKGLAVLGRYGLSFEAWLYHPQLMELADLARAFPDMTIILNHIGGALGIGPYAGQRDSVFQAWRHGIAEVAACPNVVVKLGGLGMPLCGFDWYKRDAPPGSVELAESMAPYYLWCIERFGVDRCMFESNFPVDKVSYSYTVMWNAFKRISGGFSPQERLALFHDNAARAYRLLE